MDRRPGGASTRSVLGGSLPGHEQGNDLAEVHRTRLPTDEFGRGTPASPKSVGSSLSPPAPSGERTVGTPNEPEPPARSGRRSLAPLSSLWSLAMNHTGRWL